VTIVTSRAGAGTHRYAEICEYGECEMPATGGLRMNICEGHARIAFEDGVAAGMLDSIGRHEAQPSLVSEEQMAVLSEAMNDRVGVVYVIRLGDRIKVGFSQNYKRRLRDLPHEEIITIFPRCTVTHERHLHGLLAKWRVTGEWFKDCPEVRAIIASADK
jgi:hypothetical protein